MTLKTELYSRPKCMVPFYRLGMVSYLCSMITFYTKTVFEIFDIKNSVTLKTGWGVRQGHDGIYKCNNSFIHALLFMSYYRTSTGSCMCSIEWWHFQWPWLTHNSVMMYSLLSSLYKCNNYFIHAIMNSDKYFQSPLFKRWRSTLY